MDGETSEGVLEEVFIGDIPENLAARASLLGLRVGIARAQAVPAEPAPQASPSPSPSFISQKAYDYLFSAGSFEAPAVLQPPRAPKSQIPALISQPSKSRIEIIDKIGQGGMGAVFRAKNASTGRELALKRMIEIKDPHKMLLFKDEFRRLSQLIHPNLVRLHDLIEEDGQISFTMDLIHGSPLTRWIQFPMNSEISSWFLGHVLPRILDALEYLHANHCIHCDLKPDNIMIAKNGEVKLVDFGLARPLRSETMSYYDGVNLVAGTPDYMAPEQAQGLPLDEKADLYAVGIILFEIMTGVRPFTGDPMQVLAHHMITPPPQIKEVFPGVDPRINNISFYLLSKNPNARPTIEQIRNELGLQRHSLSPPPKIAHGFVGRQKERVELGSYVQQVKSRSLQAVFIHGESGQGKTALAEEMVAYARTVGFQVFRGQSYEREAVPFKAWDVILDQIALRLRNRSMREALPRLAELGPLSQIFPSLKIIPAIASTDGLLEDIVSQQTDPRILKQGAYNNLRVLFEILGPVVLVIDDLQWTDAESLELLEALLQKASNLPILILGIYRDVQETHPLSRFLEEHPKIHEILLGPLGEEEVRQLTAQVMGRMPRASLAPIIFKQTKGNPFFVEVMAEHLAAANLDQEPATWTPPTLNDLVHARLAKLSESARLLADIVSVAGGAVREGLLRQAANLLPEVLDQALDNLCNAKVFRPTDPDEGTFERSFDFYHARLREATYGRLSDPASRHRWYASQLESAPQQNFEALYQQWLLAGDKKKAIHYGKLAAEAAAARLAFGRASEILENVLKLQRALGAPLDSKGRQKILSEIHEPLVNALEHIGEYRKSIPILEDALEIASVKPEIDAKKIRLHLADNLVKTGDMEKSIAHFEYLLKELGLKLARPKGNALSTIGGLMLRTALTKRFPGRLRKPTESDTFELNLFHKIFESYGFVFPLFMAEYHLRYQILASRLIDPKSRVLSIAIDAIYKTLRGLRSDKVLEAHKLLNLADQKTIESERSWAVAYTLGIRGFIDLAAGRWGPAKKELEAVIEKYRVHNAMGLWEIGACRIWLMLACYYAGPESQAEELAFEFIQEKNRNVVTYSMGQWILNGIRLRHGALKEAREAMDEWVKEVPVKPMTYARALYETSVHALRIAEGKASRVLETYEATEKNLDVIGFRLGVWERAHWDLPILDAAVSVARKGTLTPAQKKMAEKRGLHIGKNSPNFFASVAFRSLALIEHYSGDKPKREKYLKEALELSATAGVRYNRWLCLSAAHEMDLLDPKLKEELATLEIEDGYKDQRDVIKKTNTPTPGGPSTGLTGRILRLFKKPPSSSGPTSTAKRTVLKIPGPKIYRPALHRAASFRSLRLFR